MNEFEKKEEENSKMICGHTMKTDLFSNVASVVAGLIALKNMVKIGCNILHHMRHLLHE